MTKLALACHARPGYSKSSPIIPPCQVPQCSSIGGGRAVEDLDVPVARELRIARKSAVEAGSI